MAEQGLRQQQDLESLTAWMDGELPGAEADRVARLVESDPDWQATHRQFQSVDAALDRLPEVRPPAGLTERILARAQRPAPVVLRILRLTGAVAAAACLVLAVWMGLPTRSANAPQGGPALEARINQVLQDVAQLDRQIDENLKDVPAEDRLIVKHLPLFQDYDEVREYRQVRDVADAATLSALAELDKQSM